MNQLESIVRHSVIAAGIALLLSAVPRIAVPAAAAGQTGIVPTTQSCITGFGVRQHPDYGEWHFSYDVRDWERYQGILKSISFVQLDAHLEDADYWDRYADKPWANAADYYTHLRIIPPPFVQPSGDATSLAFLTAIAQGEHENAVRILGQLRDNRPNMPDTWFIGLLVKANFRELRSCFARARIARPPVAQPGRLAPAPAPPVVRPTPAPAPPVARATPAPPRPRTEAERAQIVIDGYRRVLDDVLAGTDTPSRNADPLPPNGAKDVPDENMRGEDATQCLQVYWPIDPTEYPRLQNHCAYRVSVWWCVEPCTLGNLQTIYPIGGYGGGGYPVVDADRTKGQPIEISYAACKGRNSIRHDKAVAGTHTCGPPD